MPELNLSEEQREQLKKILNKVKPYENNSSEILEDWRFGQPHPDMDKSLATTAKALLDQDDLEKAIKNKP